MRLAVLSDIHGNVPALESVLEDARFHRVDAFAVAGDCISGPEPERAMSILRDLHPWMIRGNNEDYCLACAAGTVSEGWAESKQWASARWSQQHLSSETLAYIGTLPAQCTVTLNGSAPIRVVHGSLSSAREHLYPDQEPVTLRVFREEGLLDRDVVPQRLSETTARLEEPVLVCGHSHIAWVQREPDCLVVNAGSVGAPINGDTRAQYVLLSWSNGGWEAKHRFVEYDLARLRQAYDITGYLAEGGAFARACLLAIETGHNVAGRFVKCVYAVAAKHGYAGPVIPDGVWDTGVASFDWEGAASV